ncbi:MAG: hypothetical protein NTY64_20400, partial [Deltaproteobacteria bacterium]|nr:hypothetical protein [Deltaproteobacteria bacterium]
MDIAASAILRPVSPQGKGPFFQEKVDGFVKSPSAASRFTFVATAYHPSTPHSSVPLRAGLRAGSR